MKPCLKYSWLLIAVISLRCVCAQSLSDTTVQLHTVTVDTLRYDAGRLSRWRPGTLTEFKDAEGRKYSEVLADYSGIYLKTYGIGQLSSISYNGSSAAQTEMQWNGIKLNSANTGQVDFSLFDIGAGDRLSISDRGINGGSIGGVVSLDNSLSIARGTTFRSDNTVRVGSFGEHIVSTTQQYRYKGFQGSTRLGYLGADNDFPFVNNTQLGAPLMRQVNAATRLLSAMQQLQFSLPKNIVVGADFWLTDADRQLPPAMTSARSDERQWDRSYRGMVHLSGHNGKFRYTFRSAYLYDHLRYVDSTASIDSRSTSQAIRNIFTARYEVLSGLMIEARAHYDREIVFSSGYDHSWWRDLPGGAIEIAYAHPRGFLLKGNVGLEALNKSLLPVPASLSLGYHTKVRREAILLMLTGTHAYRLPALNDLYWNVGGNPELRPEKAWKGGLHTTYAHSFWLKCGVDGFYNYVVDWIQWSPQSTSAIWTAQNIKRVLSRGVTVEARMQSRPDMSVKAFAVSGNLSYTYTNTISLDSFSSNDNSRYKQLIYVPLHSLTAAVQVQYRYFYLRVMQTYTSLRFITTDNSGALAPVYLTHLEIGKNFWLHGQQIGLSFRINNLINQQYQLISQRPMPGRGFEGTVKINLSK